MSTGAFGPTAIVTPANAITLGRLLVTPVFLALVMSGGASWPAVTAWIALAVTDGLDGYLARRMGTTRSGAFLDPLADKFLVLGALVALVAQGSFWWVPVALIATRELAVSAYRSVMARRGVSIPARYWAKVKTVIQEVAVGFALLPLTADEPRIASTWLWAATVLTLWTGGQYFLDGRRTARP
jgi:CDP-diacylglycerol---glycerol-3-phosphate 3-phosphatidyltransferase